MDHRNHPSPAFHLLSGAVGGTVGATVTCPLDVVKTRLQSKNSSFHVENVPKNGFPGSVVAASRHVSLLQCFRTIVQKEGSMALFKGLGPNLVGVAPSRAIYFYCYSTFKDLRQSSFPRMNEKLGYMMSAGGAGFVTCTTTNPIWFIKTKVQLDKKETGVSAVRRCIFDTYKQYGLRGFYQGVTASYFGISETMLYFVLYESLKAQVALRTGSSERCNKSVYEFYCYMAVAASSKSMAAILAYPHEVARTRMREDNSRYTKFFQTIRTVAAEEGVRALYRGLFTHLVRSIPNTAIMMGTYETCLYVVEGLQTQNAH